MSLGWVVKTNNPYFNNTVTDPSTSYWVTPDNQVPGGLFAALQVKKPDEKRVLAHFKTYEQRSGIAVEFEDRLYNASTGTLLEILHDETAAEVLLVLAHNPGISRLAFELGGANAEDESVLRDGFAPATLAVFEVSGEWRDLSASATRLERFERAD